MNTVPGITLPDLYDQFTFTKDVKNTQRGKDSSFNKWYKENRTDTCKIMKLDPSHIVYKNSK